MPSSKSAISLPTTLLKKVDRYVKREKLSRSGFFALAAERMLREQERSDITRKINEILEAHPETTEEQKDRERFVLTSSRAIIRLTKDDKW